jgi:predicted RNase H-like HicB family nuclease
MSPFTFVIHEQPTGGFWGEVPALPGCYAQEETVEGLPENMREAIAGVLEVTSSRDQWSVEIP